MRFARNISGGRLAAHAALPTARREAAVRRQRTHARRSTHSACDRVYQTCLTASHHSAGSPRSLAKGSISCIMHARLFVSYGPLTAVGSGRCASPILAAASTRPDPPVVERPLCSARRRNALLSLSPPPDSPQRSRARPCRCRWPCGRRARGHGTRRTRPGRG